MASVTVYFSGQEQGNFTLDRPRMVAGRDEGCAIRIDNLGISREHCAICARGPAFVVQDLGSANGTFVNSKRITEHYLNDGDEIVIGVKYALRFRNEVQSPPLTALDQAVPDTQNTYVVDGAKIQEQLTRMRAAQQASGGAPAAAAGAAAGPAPGATAREYAQAMSPGLVGTAQEVEKLRILLTIATCAAVLFGAAAFILFILYLTK
jgi:predicted component of type VI protein secretion system